MEIFLKILLINKFKNIDREARHSQNLGLQEYFNLVKLINLNHQQIKQESLHFLILNQ